MISTDKSRLVTYRSSINNDDYSRHNPASGGSCTEYYIGRHVN